MKKIAYDLSALKEVVIGRDEIVSHLQDQVTSLGDNVALEASIA